MHPVLFHIGRYPVSTYGIISLIGFIACVWILRRYSVREGLDPGKMTDAVVLITFVAFAGARLFQTILIWDEIMADPRNLKLIVFSAGPFLGGVVTGIPFAFWWFRRIKVDMPQGLDLLALVAAMCMAVSRWGCFFSGCCFGKPTDLPWGVHFPELAQRLHEGLPDVPVHPTQVYLSLNSAVILAVLIWFYRNKRFHGRIITIYLILYPITRFFIEYVRGDEVRGSVFGGLLSTSQLISVIAIVLASAGYIHLSRRHRLSGEPDWRPAAGPAKSAGRKKGKRKGRR